MVARAGGNQAVTSSWEAGDTPEVTVIPGATEDVFWLYPKDRHPNGRPPLGMQPGGGLTPPALCNLGGRQTPPALCDLGGGSPSKIQV